jgi:hypothetical protein
MALAIRIGIVGAAAHRLNPSAPYGGMMRSLVTRTFTLNPGRKRSVLPVGDGGR